MTGFGHLLQYELGRWWRTTYWLAQLCLWTALVGGILAAALWGTPSGANPSGLVSDPVAEAARGLVVTFGVLVPIGTLVAMQGVILGDRHDGGLAWLLSLPVSRPAVLLARAVAHASGLLVTAVLAQAALAGVLLRLRLDDAAPALLLPMLAFALLQAFYLSFALLLGTLVPGRGWLIGIGVLVLLAQELLLDAAGVLGDLLPSALSKHVAQPLLVGQPAAGGLPIAATAAWIAACLVLATWRLNRAEL